MSVAIVTGGSRGLGAALATALGHRGWQVVVDARTPDDLLGPTDRPGVHPVTGDVTDPAHRDLLVAAAASLGGAALLVNNASTLGASPMPRVADLEPEVLTRTLATNLVAAHALTRQLLPQLLAHHGTVVNLTSDASLEPYAGWGAYAASKAGLDQLTRVLGVEQPGLRVYAVDPGDMRTRLHQDAFPGEDVSDRPEPASVVPRLLALLDADLPSGRVRAVDVPAGLAATA